MITRILEASEYDRLKGLAHTDDWIPTDDTARVLVAEKDGEIIAFWVAQAEIHIEPLWIKPDERRGMLAKELLQGIKSMVSGKCYAFTESDTVAGYLERLGMREIKRRIFVGE
jgi:hypothetical protein